MRPNILRLRHPKRQSDLNQYTAVNIPRRDATLVYHISRFYRYIVNGERALRLYFDDDTSGIPQTGSHKLRHCVGVCHCCTE